jgi:hypothetical protein
LTKVYKWIKIGGILSFLPFILAAGPLAGFFLADYLEKKFHTPGLVSVICVVTGFLASLRETVKIVRKALDIEKEDEGKG